MRKNSIKNTRVNSEVQKELSLIIADLKDPRIDPMATVTDVSVTPDLKYCTAYISVLGGEENEKNTLAGLENAMGHIRHELAVRVNLRITPELKFVIDKSLEYGINMSRLIEEVIAKDDAAREMRNDSENENQ